MKAMLAVTLVRVELELFKHNADSQFKNVIVLLLPTRLDHGSACVHICILYQTAYFSFCIANFLRMRTRIKREHYEAPTCESEAMILMAPKSWRMSSAAIVSARILDSANATSFLMFLERNVLNENEHIGHV